MKGPCYNLRMNISTTVDEVRAAVEANSPLETAAHCLLADPETTAEAMFGVPNHDRGDAADVLLAYRLQLC